VIDRLALTIPDTLPSSLYWSSCRAVLVLTTSLGLQVTAILMIGIGPLAELPYDPAELTNAGRFFLSAEYDTQAYAAGCALTILLAWAGLSVWNRLLLAAREERAESLARSGMRLLVGMAVGSLGGFALLLAWVGPGLADDRQVEGAVLVLLSVPILLTLVVVGFAAERARRATVTGSI
jgi:hypothetical protein